MIRSTDGYGLILKVKNQFNIKTAFIFEPSFDILKRRACSTHGYGLIAVRARLPYGQHTLVQSYKRKDNG